MSSSQGSLQKTRRTSEGFTQYSKYNCVQLKRIPCNVFSLCSKSLSKVETKFLYVNARFIAVANSYPRNRKCYKKFRYSIPLNLGQAFLFPAHQQEIWNDSSVNWDLYKNAEFTKNLRSYTKYCSPARALETWPGKRMTVSHDFLQQSHLLESPAQHR